jgi:enoyl-CoA hydratase/carnithine racemase
VNGAALAGGFDLALLCDIRVAAASAFFGHPEQAFGDVIYGLLHDLVGGAVARDLCFTGRRVDATEALRLRIVSEVVADDDLSSAASRIAGEIARAPRSALVRTKAKAIAHVGIAAGLRTLDF